jgi:hypothetical protein
MMETLDVVYRTAMVGLDVSCSSHAGRQKKALVILG